MSINNKHIVDDEIRIKSASGLGDTIYIYPVARHLLDSGFKNITVMTNYPDVFQDLPVKTIKHTKDWATYKISYAGAKRKKETDQYQDVLIAAGIPISTPLEIPWEIRNNEIVEHVRKRAKGKKIALISTPYTIFGREDEWGKEYRIDYRKYDEFLSLLRDEYFIVSTGTKEPIYLLNNVDMSMVRKTSVSDLLDLVYDSDTCVYQVGHMLPICEALNKRSFCFFSAVGMSLDNQFLRTITPSKVIHKKDICRGIVDIESTKSFKRHIQEVLCRD